MAFIEFLQTSIKETNRLIKLTNRLLMLTRMGKQEEQESIIVCDAAEIPNEVIHDYELIYEQLKIAKEDITKTDRLLAIPLQGSQRKKGGTGLGLSIAKDILNQYKGNISADSKLGMGTTITIVIPYTN